MTEHSEAVVEAYEQARRAERDLRDASLRQDAEQAAALTDALQARGDGPDGERV